MKTFEETKRKVDRTSLIHIIRDMFSSVGANIPEDYYYLMADFYMTIDTHPDFFKINIAESFSHLPDLIKNIKESKLHGIYGITKDDTITIDSDLSYQNKKKYFFHELTHALQTRMNNGVEECSYYNGQNGMFLAEATAQITGEMVWTLSNDEELRLRKQTNAVTLQPNREVNALTSLYQYNETILRMLSCTTGIPFSDLVSNGFKKDGRETLKRTFESLSGNEGQFDPFMIDLEKLYIMENLSWTGYSREMLNDSTTTLRSASFGNFEGNHIVQAQIMDKIERKMINDFIVNHTPEYILDNYETMYNSLTTQQLKNSFNRVMKTISNEYLTSQDSPFQM